MYDILKNKKIAIVSLWGYPFGGGEEYLYQTAIWQTKYNITTFWLCFSNANSKQYEDLTIEEVEDIKGFIIIKIPGGFNKKTLYNWLKLLNPDMVHHQGHYRKDFYDVCHTLRLNFLTGIHFWSGVIELNPDYKNINIYENAKQHSTHKDFNELFNSKFCDFYSVSKFVSECVLEITGNDVKNLCYSGSSKIKCLIENNDPLKNKYVTIINIHKFKGGELILHLLKELKNIPFMLVRTEYLSEELDKEIENVINLRNADSNCAQCLFLERMNDVRFLYSNTKIFLASSLVDETFCRTVNEAMMNNIPVITTGQGNLKYLVENAGIILPLNTTIGTHNLQIDDMNKWKECINKLYFDDDELTKIVDATKLKYLEYSEEICEKMFIDTVKQTLIKSKANNIMILTPWCDQGLGIQSRNYYKILKMAGFQVAIFSIKPYNSNSALEMQKDPNEWIVDNIYYSPNDREKITDIELLEFINKYNIGKCIIPETCWFRIFEIAKLLKNNGVKCFAIPNVEIIRKDEIVKHKYFYKILCNNKLCEKIFNDHGIFNTEYINYGIIDNKITFKQKMYSGELKFLFIGGMNAFSRKHILEICEGFVAAYKETPNIRLTCTIQKTNLLETDDVNKLNTFMDHPGIIFIQDHLKYNDIIELYYNHHISIQVSKHEGLGLGFYEALATGTPVLSLNTPPHNEIILDGVNGWIIECYHKTMMDNNDSFIKSAYFDPLVLKNKILEIEKSSKSLHELSKKILLDYNKRLSGKLFINKLINALN